ncbi:MAG: class I tRNA ligase family protein, partial [Alphaproteobacteria bacterium]|nr:class I tRNA ligase family protein [Alphaproteobacteria bacterium]
WYVKGTPLAAKCLQAIERGDVEFVNGRDRKVMRNWLENIEDWCISRQLWWGHRIPAWFKGQEGTPGFELKVQEASPGPEWRQDEDILDTWFSSAMWPFATQGWPNATTERLDRFYPNQAINSGRDILFFWLVRMMMMGLELMGQVPFKTIYTHGLILDEKGQKMSKSKGNVLNPLELMDKYGTDALRLTMASIASAEDMRFSEQKVEQNRNFCTKLWNAARLLQLNGVSYNAEVSKHFSVSSLQHPVNQWLVEELKAAYARVDGHLDAWEFNQAAHTAYHFTWGTFCDWYLELSKPLLQGGGAVAEETKACMAWAFTQLLGLLHPFIPFITEELWQRHTAAGPGQFLMLQPWPQLAQWPTFAAGHVQTQSLVEVLTALRQARTQHKLPPKAKLQVFIRNAKPELLTVLRSNAAVLASIGGVEGLTPRNEAAGQGEALLQAAGAELILPLQGLVDFAAERSRLEKELGKQQSELEKLMGLLNNPSFVARAPEAEVADKKARQVELLAALQGLQELLNGPYKV